MNFNTFFSMNPNMGIAGNLAAGPQMTGAQSFPGQSQEGFTDVLDLVNDLALVEEHSGRLVDGVNTELGVLTESLAEQSGLRTTSGAALSEDLVGAQNVASKMISKDAATLETSESQFGMLGAQMNSLESEGAALLKAKAENSANHQVKSLESWALPMLDESLGSVETRGMTTSPLEQNKLLSQAKLGQFAVSSQEVGSHALGLSALAQGRVPSGSSGQASSRSSSQISENGAMLVGDASALSDGSSGQAEQRPDRISQLVGKDANLGEQGSEQMPAPKGRLAESLKHGEAQSFSRSDFAIPLNQFTGSSDVPVVEMPAKLLSPGDQRVSTEALSFVSEKVDGLKAQGGGELIVKLNPKELGEVQISVKKEFGRLSVSLSADKASTVELFKQSEVDLRGSLEHKGADLEIVQVKQTKLQNSSSGQRFGHDAMSTEQFMSNTRDQSLTAGEQLNASSLGTSKASTGAEALRIVPTDGHRVNVENKAGLDVATSSSDHDGDSGHGQEKRRHDEHAKDRWRENFDERMGA